jgi:hypothetical protein
MRMPPGVAATSISAAVSASGWPAMSLGRYFIWKVAMTSLVSVSICPERDTL